VKDNWGRPTLSIDCSFKENEKKMYEDIVVTIQEMLENVGCEKCQARWINVVSRKCKHEMGTARMGKDPKTSVLNKWNQVWDVKMFL
jgi:choline dehydrogenase-like flavoprotein